MKSIFSLVLSGALCAFPSLAVACSCAPPPAPKIALEKSAAVFVGQVTSVEKSEYSSTFQFAVSKKWKGIAGATASVISASNSAACGIDFEPGRDYLVYASKIGDDNELRTNLCSRTKRVSDAAEDLAELGAPTSETPTETTTYTMDDNGVIQLNSATEPGDAVRPLALLNEALQDNATAREIRLNWKFNWKLNTFPPTIRSGNATALYNRNNSTLKLYSSYNDAVGSYVKHVLYRGVTDEMLQQLADKYRADGDSTENFAFLDNLSQVGASATDLGSVTHKRRIFNLK